MNLVGEREHGQLENTMITIKNVFHADLATAVSLGISVLSKLTNGSVSRLLLKKLNLN